MSGTEGRTTVGRGPDGTDGAMVVTRSEEELLVGRTWRARERVRVRKRVVSETMTYTVEVRREELVIEREPASGSAVPHDQPSDDDAGLEIVLHEEQVVLEKRVVPRERVRVRKERITEERAVSADLRREEVDIQAEGAVRRAT